MIRLHRFPTLRPGLARALVAATLGLFAPWPLVATQTPDEELATLRALPGYSISLFASEEGGVVKPTQIRFDGDGRLWVATTTSYPQLRPGETPRDRIVVLEDTDHDGRADRTTVFDDRLHMPLGLELGDGGVYVGAADQLLFLKDTDGDGKADLRRVIFSGFGTGDTHQTLNSFTWGPSGELMMSQGLHAVSRIETPWGNETLHQAGLWRFWPRSLRLDAFWDGAMGAHNPFGTTFDRAGQPFVFAGNGHGIAHLTQAMIRTEHFEAHPPLWNQGRKFGGADIADNGHWLPEHRGEFVAGGYLHNSVERFRMTPKGASFQVDRLPPLVESTNTAFRVVDVRFGPDGALYLCDWFNSLIGHYQTSFRHPDRDRTRGRIWRVTANGRVPLKAPAPLEKAALPALFDALLSPERWNRQLAARVLKDRPTEAVVAGVRAWVAAAPSGEGRLERLNEAIGILAAHEVPEPDFLAALSRSPDPDHRARAARVTGHWAGRLMDPLEILGRLATDAQPRVRLEAVVACAYVPDARAVEVASLAMEGPEEAPITYAFTQCVHALKPLWKGPYGRGSLAFGGSQRRKDAFTRADRSADTVDEAATRLRRVQEVALPADTQASLVESVLAAARPQDLPLLLAPRTHTVGAAHDAGAHARALLRLDALGRDSGLKPSQDVRPALAPLLAGTNAAIRAAAARLVGRWQVVGLEADVARLVEAADTEEAVRVGAILGLALFPAPEHTGRILRAAGPGAGRALKTAAAAALPARDPDTSARLAAEVLARETDAASIEAVAAPILRQPRGAPSLARALQATPPHPASARGLAAFLAQAGRNIPELAPVLGPAVGRASSGPTLTERLASPAARTTFLQTVSTSGDAARGARIFAQAELGCTACHGVGASQPGLGPDLGALGTAQTPEFILRAILEPQAEVKEGFMSWNVTLRNGEEVQGRIESTSEQEVVLLDAATRKPLRLARSGIVSQAQAGSIMPAGLVDALAEDELRDLIGYLAGLGRRDR
ncbi:MAG: c-type cytochrome [Verrucomicrobia bacterium]|nr:c-type cytochrome [Verrucomicrobiota bacterium]